MVDRAAAAAAVGVVLASAVGAVFILRKPPGTVYEVDYGCPGSQSQSKTFSTQADAVTFAEELVSSATGDGYAIFSVIDGAKSQLASGTAPGTCSPTTIPVTVSIGLDPSSSPGARTYAVFFDSPPGPYIGGGAWTGGSPWSGGNIEPGDTVGFTIDLAPGHHTLYFVTSVPDTGYGADLGMITIAGTPVEFDDVTEDDPASVPFTVSA